MEERHVAIHSKRAAAALSSVDAQRQIMARFKKAHLQWSS
jgi:hypothetical protein